jgi:predicted metal-dependent peptidase
MTTDKRIIRAKTLLLLDHPFFGMLAARLRIEPDETVETAVTNGVRLRYNPKFLAGISDQELVGVLAHVVMHIANGHCWRRGDRDPSQWNEAGDYAINHHIIEAGMRLPKGALIDPALTGAAEAIFAQISKKPRQDSSTSGDSGETAQDAPGSTTPDGRGSTQPSQQDAPGANVASNSPSPADPGRCGAVEDAPVGSEGQNEAGWKQAVAEALEASAGMGDLPAGIQTLMRAFVDPPTPWYVLLRDFVERTARNDYNWTRPNKRHAGQGIIMPSLINDELPEVVIGFDTSGSCRVTEAIAQRFAAEASAVLGAYDTTIRVVYCDTKVQATETFRREDLPIEFHPKGGGGTSFVPVFDWVDREGITPACLIYLTDGEGRFPTADPGYPVLWATVANERRRVAVPFGDIVIIDGE